MAIRIYNTLTKKKEEFAPLKKGSIKMYVCGPTVYDFGHIGHARSAISFDVIRRYFSYLGYKIKFVSNYTDIDDKIIRRAKEKGITEQELSESMIKEYKKDYAELGILEADISPKATEHIPEMIELIKKLEKKGFTYSINDGVYFNLNKFKDYGKLSGQKLSELKAGARVKIEEHKKHPQDFCLWKFKKQGEPFWSSPWGEGRPGWHIECSAMCLKHLGETFDIHGGGQDLIFPHHEDEIAQSECATGKPFAKYWMHNGFVNVDNEKMSKSLGNFFTIKDVLKKYDPKILRFFLLSMHYRQPINFADTLLDQAKNSLQRLWDFMSMLESRKKQGKTSRKKIEEAAEKARIGFEGSMNDDFEISGALRALFNFVKEINALNSEEELTKKEAGIAIKFMKQIDAVLNVLEHKKGTINNEIEAMIQKREEARKNKDFKTADRIRDELAKKGIRLNDTPGGVKWERI